MDLQTEDFNSALYWAGITILLFVFQQISQHFRKMNKDKHIKALIISGIPLLATALIQSLLLEVGNIFNKHGVVLLTSPYRMYLIVMVSAVCISVLIYLYLSKRPQINHDVYHILGKVYIPIIIITIIFIIVQPARTQAAWSEYFETANHGLSLDHLFRYGSIPIVETFDAHMLANQIFGYVYYLLNGYEPWAFMLYDGMKMILFIVIVYYLLKHLIGRRNALLFILVFPALGSFIPFFYIMAGIVAIALIKLKQNPTRLREICFFWSAVCFAGLWSLDTGMAAAVGGVAVYLLPHIIQKNKKGLRRFILSGACFAAFLALVFSVLCIAKGINPIDRVKEFLSASMSNQKLGISKHF